MKHFTILLSLLISLNALAQLGVPHELDRIYSPPANSILGSDNIQISGTNSTAIINKNSVKLNAFNLCRSNLLFFYERNFNTNMAFTVGAGMPFGKDWIHGVFYDAIDLSSTESTNTDLEYNRFIDEISFKNGFILSSSFRIYNDHSSYYDFAKYFEVGVKKVYRTLDYDTSRIDFDKLTILTRENKTSITSFYGNFGWQWTGGKDKLKFTHEFCFGTGIKVLSFEGYKGNDIYFQEEFVQSIFTKNGMKVKKIMPYFSISYNIGFGW